MTTTQAAVVESPGAPFILQNVELDGPRQGEVLVRMEAAADVPHRPHHRRRPHSLPAARSARSRGRRSRGGGRAGRDQGGAPATTSCSPSPPAGTAPTCRLGHPAYCTTWIPQNLIGGKRGDGTSPISRDGKALGGRFFGQSSFSRYSVADRAQRGQGRPRPAVRTARAARLQRPDRRRRGVERAAARAPAPRSRWWAPAPSAWRPSWAPPSHRSARSSPWAGGRTSSNWPPSSAPPTRSTTTRPTSPSRCGRSPAGPGWTTWSRPWAARRCSAPASRPWRRVARSPSSARRRTAWRSRSTCTACCPAARILGVCEGDSDPDRLIPLLARLVRSGRLLIQPLIKEYPFADIQSAVHDFKTGQNIKTILRFDT